MYKYYQKIKSVAFSETARDTYLLFIGNTASAFWGFLFILIIARAMSVSDFGVFSAAVNLATILISVVDAGISGGAVNFVSEAIKEKDKGKSDKYIKASLVVRTLGVLFISMILILFSPLISKALLATNDSGVAVLTALLCIFIFPNSVFPYIFQAKREFLRSVVVDNANFIFRLIAAYILILVGYVKLPMSFWAFFPGFIITLILSFYYMGFSFLKSRPSVKEYKNLMKFSGWIGVNRVVSGISGRLDVQMLASMTSATVTGLYSIPQRLAMLIPVFTGSYSAVLAPRLASFSSAKEQKNYILKTFLGTIPMLLGCLIVIVFGRQFVTVLFGEKYLPAVPVFQRLVFSYLPFIVSVPAVTAIIYTLKKTIYIGAFSIFQLAAVFLLNLVFIPKYGSLGPTYTFTLLNTILALYSWTIVFQYYNSRNRKDN